MSTLPASAGEQEIGFQSGTQVAGTEGRRRILFVDDDPTLLDGLKAVLRPQRREWEMAFALGGAAALQEVRSSAFDVVITDMRMPVVDGAEVLRQVKAQQPRAVRVVLSGQTDNETAMRTVFTAHQFLAKPCEVDKLRSVVKRACGLQELVTAEELRALAGDASQLPSAPNTYLEITEALADPSCDIQRVAGIVERDPALSAKVLQLVNSAFFGLPRAVTSIARATSYLGTLTLRNLALAMETLAASRPGGDLSPAGLHDFQVNSLLAGMLARHWFAGDRQRADDAFVAGLLRGVGALLLARQGRDKAVPPGTHAALSAYILGLWGLPHSVLEPVAFHERPEQVEHQALEVVDVVHLAHQLAAELAPCPFQPPPTPLDVTRLERLGAASERVDRFRADAREILAQTRGFLRR